MAILLTSAAARLARSGLFRDPALDWTTLGWVRFDNPAGSNDYTFRMFATDDGGGAFTTPYAWIGRALLTNVVQGEADTGGGAVDTATVAIVTGTWVHLALRYKASTTALTLVVKGVSAAPVTIDLSAVSPIAFDLAGADSSPSDTDIALAYLRDWQRWLTEAEIVAESTSPFAVLLTDLLADTPLMSTSDLRDATTAHRDWTAIGTLETVAGPGPTGDFCATLYCPPPTPCTLPPGCPVTMTKGICE